MEVARRRSSLSQTIEACIRLLSDYISKECNTEIIEGLLINNNCFSELRSFLWRVFLGIIPSTSDILKICEAITKTRNDYEVLLKKHKIEQAEQEKIFLILDKINKEINIDFLKSHNLKETISKLYLIWKAENKYTKEYEQALYIISYLVYAIYPSVLPSDELTKTEIKTQEEATSRNLFYMMNNEDFFDADVFNIFSLIMKKYNIIEIIEKYENDKTEINFEKLIEEYEGKNEEKKKEYIEQADLHLKISFLYPYILEKKVIKKFIEVGNYDPYNIIKEWYFYFYSKVFPIKNIGYIWDICFMSKYPKEIIAYLIAAIMKTIKNEILASNTKEDVEKCFKNFPQEDISLKDIFKKAFKLQEKIHEE